MLKRFLLVLTCLLSLTGICPAADAAAPAPVSAADRSANLVQIAGMGADKLAGTNLSELKWFVDKTTFKSNLTGDKQRSTGYEATATIITTAKLKDGSVSLLSEKWYVRTGGKEEGLFRGITERVTVYQGKEEALKDVPVSKVASKSQDETIASYIMLYDTERLSRQEKAAAAAAAKK